MADEGTSEAPSTEAGADEEIRADRLAPPEAEDERLEGVRQGEGGEEAADAGAAGEGVEIADGGGSEPGEPSSSEPGAESSPSPEELSPSESSAACPGQTFEESCYAFVDELVSWTVAEQLCVDWGGHLASVESAEEDAFLSDWPIELAITEPNGSGIWLGGTDAEEDGDFRWSDDSPTGFDNWAPAQPDNGAGLDCIEKRSEASGAWYDRRCSDEQRYVCERPL